MPTYQYRCTACGDEIERVQKFSDPALTTCEECGGSLRKVYNAVGIVFKGSGFYATDNRTSGASAAASPAGESKETAKPAAPAEKATPSASAAAPATGGAPSTATTN